MEILDYNAIQDWLWRFDPNGGDGDEKNAAYFRALFANNPQAKSEVIQLLNALMRDKSKSPLEKFETAVGAGPSDDADASKWLKHIYQVVTGEPWVGD